MTRPRVTCHEVYALRSGFRHARVRTRLAGNGTRDNGCLERVESEPKRTALSRWLERAPPALFAAYAVTSSFVAYFCMYGFRKAFAAAKLVGTVHLPWVGALDVKVLYILCQVLGYCLSKFIGIKVVSEVPPSRRAAAILVCIAVAEVGLLLFGVLPAPYRAVGMFVNGLPLGMIWGLVFGFLEGRKVSDFLGAGLSASFILASGFVKSVGVATLSAGVSEAWMPALVGLMFAPPMVVAVWLLSQVPPPSKEDEAARMKRAPMSAEERRAFFRAHATGLVALIAAYVALTALRDFRDNFAREIWESLGYGEKPAILTTSEIPVAIGALVAVGSMMAIRDNRRALLATHALVVFGAVVVAGSTLLFQLGLLGPAPWMIAVGLGLYIGYVPFNCVLFDRLIATTRSVATAGFLITLADAFGYLGSTSLLVGKSLGKPTLPWLASFEAFSYVGALVCAVCMGFAAFTFAKLDSVKVTPAPAK